MEMIPHYRELEDLKYNDNGTERELQVPKGDVLHQFREDVKNGKLPTVSWLTAPENFSAIIQARPGMAPGMYLRCWIS